jgi:hypothetical protein
MAIPIGAATAVATAARPLAGNLLRLLPFFGAGAAGQLLVQAAQQDGIRVPENVVTAIHRKTFEVGLDPSGNLVLIPTRKARRRRSARMPRAVSEALKAQAEMNKTMQTVLLLKALKE